MSWTVRISRQAREDLDYHRAYEPETYRNCYDLTKSVEGNPYEGPGTPQNASALGQGVWFRRLSLQHRMVYEVFENLVVVASYRSHIE